MAKTQKTGVSPTRVENYPEWYQQVIKAAEMAENSAARGCMIIKPWGWGIWENLKKALDDEIKATGHENAYFPLFIPLSFLEREAEHVEGFAKECAVVTHHRLEESEGKLVPTGELEEPFIVRPTSETIIGDAFSRWVQSYRDLPLLINQWANVVRWEMRPRMFLRTAEFLWQEGHTAHASEEEARDEVKLALDMYKKLAEEVLAIPVICGEKTAGERFPGAETTTTIEAMMQDGKALQAGTSHYLGQNFSKACGIKFLDKDEQQKFAHTTSWGVSTRLIGGLIMVHADDDGMRVPPRVAPQHAVILPVIPKDELKDEVLDFTSKLSKELSNLEYNGEKVRVKHDDRDLRGGEKSWQWIKKGIPLRIEVGPRDIEKNSVVLFRRDKGVKEKEFLTVAELKKRLPQILEEIQNNYFQQAKKFRDDNIVENISDFTEMKAHFEKNSGFVLGKFSGDSEAEESLKELKLTIRCIPFDMQRGGEGKCLVTGKPATQDVLFAKAY